MNLLSFLNPKIPPGRSIERAGECWMCPDCHEVFGWERDAIAHAREPVDCVAQAAARGVSVFMAAPHE